MKCSLKLANCQNWVHIVKQCMKKIGNIQFFISLMARHTHRRLCQSPISHDLRQITVDIQRCTPHVFIHLTAIGENQ